MKFIEIEKLLENNTWQMETNSIEEFCKICRKKTKITTDFKKDGYKFIECSNCKIKTLQPFPSEKKLRNHYSTRQKLGNYKQANAKFRISSLKQVFDKLRNEVVFSKNKKPSILDVGCFDGEFLDLAKKAGWQTYGIEYMTEPGQIAAKNHKIFIGRIEDFSSKNKYDIITAIGLIEHLQQPYHFFKFIQNHLDNNGICLIQTPNYESWICKILGKKWFCYSAPEHTFYFSKSSLMNLMKSYGFQEANFFSHVKYLRCDYVYYQLQFWGKEIRKLISPLYNFLPTKIKSSVLPFYGGEMIYIFKKTRQD